MDLVLAHTVGPGSSEGWAIAKLWSWDDPSLLVVLLLGIVYARGLRNWPQPRALRPWQPWAFYTGLVLLVLTLASPIDVLSDDLFFMHMAQHLLLVMVIPPLVLLGAPTTPLLRGLPAWARRGGVVPLMRSRNVRSAYRAITYPPAAWLLFTINMWTWHFAGEAYELAVQDWALHIFQHWTFVFTATLFWWAIIDPRPLRARVPYGLRGIFVGITMFQNVALGAGITFQTEVLYAYYGARDRLWGITPLGDQQAGGLVMWIVGTMMLVPALVIVTAVWLRKDEERVRREEQKTYEAMRAAAGPEAPERIP